MTSTQNWKSLFTDWPVDFPRSGVVISTLNEAMPFRKFWLKDDLLLLERTIPDATGARFLLLSFDVINSVKFIIPLKESTIDEAGFVAGGAETLMQTV